MRMCLCREARRSSSTAHCYLRSHSAGLLYVQEGTGYEAWRWRSLPDNEPSLGWFESSLDGSQSARSAWYGSGPGDQPVGAVATVGAHHDGSIAEDDVCVVADPQDPRFAEGSTLKPVVVAGAGASLEHPCACEYAGAPASGVARPPTVSMPHHSCQVVQVVQLVIAWPRLQQGATGTLHMRA